jgi:hypothetical protein
VKERLIPLLWHVDGIEIYRNTEFLVWSWASAVCDAVDVWDQKFVFTILPAVLVQHKPVFNQLNAAITKLIGWDLGVCEKGVGPNVGFSDELFTVCSRAKLAGKPLAFNACFAGLKSDGKARRDIHSFIRNYNSTWICESCWASQPFTRAPSVSNYKDFKHGAYWHHHEISHAQYMLLPERKSPWILHVRGARLDMFYHDLMHVVYLGFARDLIASCLIDECIDLPAAQKSLYLSGVFDNFKEHLKATSNTTTSMRRFTQTSLGRDKKVFPELQSVYKACHVKQLIFYLAHRYSTGPYLSFTAKVKAVCVWALADFLHMAETCQRFLSLDQRPQRASRLCGPSRPKIFQFPGVRRCSLPGKTRASEALQVSSSGPRRRHIFAP